MSSEKRSVVAVFKRKERKEEGRREKMIEKSEHVRYTGRRYVV